MRVISLLCSLLLLVACSSNSSSDGPVPKEAESKYSKDLPATDLGADDSSDHFPQAGSASAPESGYSRQFVLEEEVIASARDASDSPSLVRETDEFKAPTEPVQLPPLDQTFTLQLAAVKDMDQAIEYARRYGIGAEKAGVARILSKGELWYVLAYGVYASREEANLAKADLQAVGIPEPWVRSLATLEALAKEASDSGF